MVERERALFALRVLDPGCQRDEWVRIGMAAKAAGLTLDDFTNWSSSAGNFNGERDCASAWHSFKDGEVGAGTLIYLGWQTGRLKGPARGRLNGHGRPANGDGGCSPSPKAKGAQRGAIAALEVWAQCISATDEHPYIVAKQGYSDGLRVVPDSSRLTIAGERMAGWLAVPVLDRSGAPMSLQFIAPPESAARLRAKGVAAKLNLPGASMAGTFTVGELLPGGLAYLVEGIGTAWACHTATWHAAVVCFGWGSVQARAKEMRDRDPSAVLVIVPDIGKEAKALEVARAVRAKVAAMPEGWPENSDMCDLGLRDGFDAVEHALLSAKDPSEPGLRYRLLESCDLDALPPLAWRIRGVLPAEGTASIYGPSTSGKSFLALDMAAAIGAGRDWFGFRVTAAPVVYCALEGEAGIRTRVKAWEKANGRAMPARLVLQPFRLTNADDVRDLAAAIGRFGPGAVIYLDTLNRAAPTADENSSKDMGAILEGTKELQRLSGGLVALVHHTGKDATKGLRGHSSLFAGLDAAIEVSRNGGLREWRVEKSKDGEDGATHSFRLEIIDLGTDDAGEPVTSCVVAPDTGPREVKRAKLPQGGNQRIAWDALGPLFQKGRTGIEGAPPQRPCVEVEAAVLSAASRLTCPQDRRTERARKAIEGLVARGLFGCHDGWLWVV